MSSEARSVLFAANGHPDENQLFLALERELSPEEAGEVERHLGNCWSCRARSEEMQRGILTFVEYREKRFLPSLASPPDEFRQFRGRLRDVVEEAKPIGILDKLRRKAGALFASGRQVRWVSAVALAMAAVLFWVEVLHPPAVSASELLTRAVAAQNPTASAKIDAPARVAHQTVRIRSGSHTAIRKFEWTIGSPVPGARWETQRSPMDWNAPLTAAGFGEWRDSLQEKKDVVKRSGDLLTLNTTTSQSAIREAWMVVRSSDFHPVEQHVRFAGDAQLDLTEVGFEITEQTSAKAEASSAEKPQVTSAKPAESQAAVREPDLEETELQLRYLLFTHQWDLGEDLGIERNSGRVVLSGTVSSLERERALRTALNALPHLQLSIAPPDATKATQATSKQPSSAKTRAPAATPLLRDTLEERFASSEDRLAFVDRSLKASDESLSHAWALKALADRYTEANERLLKADSQARLHEMLSAHLQQVRRANADLGPLLALLEPADNLSTASAPLTWQATVLALFTQVQQQDALVANLLVGTQAEGQDLASLSARLRSTHRRIEALLSGARNRLNESR